MVARKRVSSKKIKRVNDTEQVPSRKKKRSRKSSESDSSFFDNNPTIEERRSMTAAMLVDEELDAQLEELQQGLLIDEHALDDALQQQADLYYRVSQLVTLQVSRRDAAKQYLQEVEAKIDETIRRAARLEEAKITEREIEAKKLRHEATRLASSEVLRLNNNCGRGRALEEAYHQRSYILKDMVKLYLANYFGDSGVGAASAEMRDESAQVTRDAMRKRHRRSSRAD